MTKRPTSLTAIGWILVVFGCLAVIMIVMLLLNPQLQEPLRASPLPFPIHVTMSFAGCAILVISGSGVLSGGNWARYLYVAWNIFAFSIGFMASPAKLMLLPGIVVFLIITFFLFTKKANLYFANERTE